MSILVCGGGGQIGTAIRWAALDRGVSLVGLSHADLDICDLAAVTSALVGHRPDVVINCAAHTDVDGAERQRDRVFATNADGAANLAAASAEIGLPLVHLSTDYVFDGAADRPYREDDPVCPVGVYAESKAAGEAHVRALANRHVILRTAWVFGAFGNNFVRTMLRLADQAPPSINVVDDQRGCPTPADAIAECILAICGRISNDGFDGWGTYHFCGRPPVTWYQFAEAVLAGRGGQGGQASSRLTPVATADMPRRAPRPPNSVLDCSRVRATFAIDQPDWRDGLNRMLEQIEDRTVVEPVV